MLHKKFAAAAFLVLILCGPRSVSAAPISVGVISFDTFIAGPDGSNAFFIANLTGDPALGGFALPSEFPVASFLSFDSPTLSWVGASGSPYDFGGASIGPGSLDPTPAIQFSDTLTLLSATFSATLSDSFFQLTDGRFFEASSRAMTFTLSGAGGGALVPGDFAILSIDANEVTTTSPIPEPGSLILLSSGLLMGAIRKWRSSRPLLQD
jgi:hypothetical protein